MREHDLTELEESLGYSFKNKDILAEALTHRSYCHEHPDRTDCYNERLEFLGDSVLGLSIVEALFVYDSKLTESTMAKTKSYLVKEAVLSEIAGSISLGRYLRLGKGEESTGGRKKRSLLADALEAVFGAVYIDGGYDRARKLIQRLFREKIVAIMNSGEFQDFKTTLQEKTQLLYGMVPEYVMIKEEGEEHKKVFTVEVLVMGEKLGTGVGKNKKEAETLAAREALKKLPQ